MRIYSASTREGGYAYKKEYKKHTTTKETCKRRKRRLTSSTLNTKRKLESIENCDYL